MSSKIGKDLALREKEETATGADALMHCGFERLGPHGKLFKKGEIYIRLDPDAMSIKAFVRLSWATEEAMADVVSFESGSRPSDGTPRFLFETRNGSVLAQRFEGYPGMGHIPRASIPPWESRVKGLSLDAQIAACGGIALGVDACGTAVFALEAGRGNRAKEFLMELRADGKLGGIFEAAEAPTEGLPLASVEEISYQRLTETGAETAAGSRMIFANDLHRVTLEIFGHHSKYTRVTLREPTMEEIGVKRAEPRQDPSGIWIAAPNGSLELQSLREVNGKPLEDIEEDMRYCGIELLGRHESLPMLLSNDNDIVRDAGFEHCDLAWPLKIALGRARIDCARMELNGRQFQIERIEFHREPIRSGIDRTIASNLDIKLTNAASGAKLVFWGALPDLIERYGFYGGAECGAGGVRIEPLQIARFFAIEPGPAARPQAVEATAAESPPVSSRQ